jgi:NADPH:quinone reductase-like Zn-dependent oxidoreductase
LRRDGNVGVKAVVYDHYGGPEVLRLVDVPKPSPEGSQVVVAVAVVTTG